MRLWRIVESELAVRKKSERWGKPDIPCQPLASRTDTNLDVTSDSGGGQRSPFSPKAVAETTISEKKE